MPRQRSRRSRAVPGEGPGEILNGLSAVALVSLVVLGGPFSLLPGCGADGDARIHTTEWAGHRDREHGASVFSGSGICAGSAFGSNEWSTGVSYSYSTGGAVDCLGSGVQYQFNWGDGSSSGWLATGTTSASYSWSTTGSKSVTAQARSATNNAIVSPLSSTLTAGIQVLETVTTPSVPSGPTSGLTGTTYSYSTGRSTDSLGSAVQYLLNWGDGTNSGWLATGTTSASHAWNTAQSWNVTAQARSATNNAIPSSASGALTVAIHNPETVTTPSIPSGPTSGYSGTAYSYSTGARPIVSVPPYSIS